MHVDIFFQYSILKRKLYINQNRFVNVEFRIDDKKRIQKQMLFVRALCIYIQTDHFGEPVKVCYQHSRDSSGRMKDNIGEHLIRCHHPESSYHYDSGKPIRIANVINVHFNCGFKSLWGQNATKMVIWIYENYTNTLALL